MEDFITEDLQLAVKKGIYWMDENYPGWARRIDTDSLLMENCDYCVIGQACMDQGYWEVIEMGAKSLDNANDWAIEHGFDVPMEDVPGDEYWASEGEGYGPVIQARYSMLEQLWTEEVRRRV